jgi:metal-responsive CopG/Arc/MetJ family transcriptional regulator
MAQISLYIDDSMVSKLNAAAKNRNCSVSKYVAELISERLSEDETEEVRKKQLLRQLCGVLDDDFTIEASIT